MAPRKNTMEELAEDLLAAEHKDDGDFEEEESFMQKKEALNQQIDDDLDDTLANLDDAENIGSRTTGKMAAQNEQLRGALNNLDDIDENMNSVDHSLGNMERCCLLAVLASWCGKCLPCLVMPDQKVTKKSDAKTSRAKRREIKRKKKERLALDEKGLSADEIRARNQENKLDDIADGLDVLDQIAQNQAAQITETAGLNKEVEAKVDNEIGRLKTANERGQKLLDS